MEIKLNVVISPSEEFLSLITAFLDRPQASPAPVKATKGKKEARTFTDMMEEGEALNKTLAEAEVLEKKAVIMAEPKAAEVIEAKEEKREEAAAPSVSLETLKTEASKLVKDVSKVAVFSKFMRETWGIDALTKLPKESYDAFYEQLKAL